jgi:shikimate kinase
MKEREPAYRRIANVTVEVDGKTVDEICDEIIAAIEQDKSSPSGE